MKNRHNTTVRPKDVRRWSCFGKLHATELGAMKCPNCQNAGEMHVAHMNPGGMRLVKCFTCGGTNEITDEHADAIAVGRRLREYRVHSIRASIRETAPGLGTTPTILSHAEAGILSPEANALRAALVVKWCRP